LDEYLRQIPPLTLADMEVDVIRRGGSIDAEQMTRPRVKKQKEKTRC
jgi:hypothetical protein